MGAKRFTSSKTDTGLNEFFISVIIDGFYDFAGTPEKAGGPREKLKDLAT